MASKMPKFVPRQRKHKVLARSKPKSHAVESAFDSNAAEQLPSEKLEVKDKKQLLREELRKEGAKISGKKAKRLEKYIDTKLRKDENRALIEKLAGSKVDTSLYQSSRKLGQGTKTRREVMSTALRESRAGIDIDGDNEDILFERRDDASYNGSKDEDEEQVIKASQAVLANGVSVQAKHTPSVGGGLKRPLELDDAGRPLLKKRKLRGGVQSKFSFRPESEEEPAWEGFSSVSTSDDGSISSSGQLDRLSEQSSSEELDEDDETSLLELDTLSAEDEEGSDLEVSFSDNSDSENTAQQRSSAFKTWATQQQYEAIGYKPTGVSQDATSAAKIEGFRPRALEEDPLPLELRVTSSLPRTAYSVSFSRSPEIQEARLHLPVVAEEQKIMEAVHNSSVVVIYGATGSGKTTQVPQFLYEAGYGSPESPTPGMIGVTQPRRVAAVSMAKRVGEELGDHGNRVAYQIRFEGTVSPQTAIKFMTDGVLLREVAQDIALRKYSAIIVDEAHERSVNTDILIGMLSRVVRLREELSLDDPSINPLKLIIMSATLRITDFTENETLFAVPPPVLQAEGRQYSVTNHFSRQTHHDYVGEAFKKISRGHHKLPPGGFLVFLTGQNEINSLSKRLRDAFRIGSTGSGPKVVISGQDAPIEAEDVDFGDVFDNTENFDNDSVDINIDDEDDFDVEEQGTGPSKMYVLPLYSLLPTKEQLRVFETPPDGARLVVLATNVAETSITIPGIRYVFDSGRSKERKFDEHTGVQSFEVGWISKASANQRAGRAGRTSPGHCYRLYSSAVYERDFQEFAVPEILRMPIDGVVLQLKAMNLQHVVNFPFPTPPDRRSLASSEKLLSYISALSATGQITKVGTTMSIFPLSPRFARILLVGHLHDCIHYTIALVGSLSAADVFIPENQAVPTLAPKDEDEHFTNADRLAEDARNLIRRKYNKVQRDFCFLDDRSDAIKLLQVTGEYAHDPSEAWCQHHFVRSKVLKEIFLLRRQITDLLRANIPAFSALKFQDKLDPPSPKQVKYLKQFVAAGFIDQIAMRADLAPTPAPIRRKPTRAIDVPYLTLTMAHLGTNEGDNMIYIHPSSPLAHLSPQECPEFIVYSYLQRSAPSAATPQKIPRTRMHALTDITGGQIAALAKGTPLLSYGKPIKEFDIEQSKRDGLVREVLVVPYLRAEGTGGMGWPLPARKVVQRKFAGRGWIVE